jgi:FtsP/CotA-like multicopper oxidase with cupredoxin domain
MSQRSPAVILAAVFLLCAVGNAGAQTAQTLLPGALIPKFVDQLPVAGQISLVNATGTDLVLPGPVTLPSDTNYSITMSEFQANILPNQAIPLPPPAPAGAVLPAGTPSWVWGYLTAGDNPAVVRPSYLGPVVIAKKGVETTPLYINALPYGRNSNVQLLLPIDQTLDWADPLGEGCFGTVPTGVCASIYSGPQPAVPHIHGGEVAPLYDGGPDAWWTPDGTLGSGSPASLGSDRATFIYPTQQQAGTIWFHDHALGITRLNVYAGMAGLYIITDPANEPVAGVLPAFPQHDIPLIIQDRSFDIFGQIFYNLASNPQPNIGVHPYWIPEFIGDTILVNGKTWPNLNVEPRKYRFRIVNGSNARFYDLSLSNSRPLLVIATDDGYLNSAVSTPNVIIAPGERYEIIVDFTGLKVGAKVVLKNSARTPFPGGANVVRGTTDAVMQFSVVANASGLPNATVAAGTVLRQPANAIVNIKSVQPAITRQLTLNEVIGPGGPLELVLNNTKYNGVVAPFTTRDTEQPQVGDTELWEIINITADAHPIHTHLASFQLVNRQAFQASKWITVYTTALTTKYGAAFDGLGPPLPYLTPNTDGALGGNPAIGPYLQGKQKPPLAYENGWKDTVIAYPGEVTRIMVRWAPTEVQVPGLAYAACSEGAPSPSCASSAGVNLYPFDPIGGVGYVWHCHIVDHEDNEMMRPYVVRATRQIP